MEYILTYSVFVLILSVLMGASTWKLFQKMGYKSISAFIPFYNYYIVLKESKEPKWWVIFAYFPIVGTIMMTVFHLFLMKKFGKDSFMDKVLTIFLPFLYMAKVNYASDTELVKNWEDEEVKKKDTLLGSLAYAGVFATLIHTFIAQPFAIPTGSMERTLLVGDFFFVSRMNYGFRLPMRPISIPFLQSTIFDKGKDGNPKNDPKSYVEAVKLPYFRLPGWEKVERNDIVVFNYPDDSVHIAIDRKDPYVKRAVAVAGDVLEVKAGKLFINGNPEQRMGDAEVQQAYEIKSKTQIDIPNLYQTYGFLPVREYQTESGYLYEFGGLTDKVAEEMNTFPDVVSVVPKVDSAGLGSITYHLDLEKSIEAQQYIYSNKINEEHSIFPLNKTWNKDWYGPLRIPKKGDIIEVNAETLPMYRKLISDYERNALEVNGDKISINGAETNQYEVKLDYYFMMGDNRDASLDSRYFGFVPETHIVGKPLFSWMSIEGLFSDANSSYQANGKRIRWDRMFKLTNTGETEKISYWWVAVIVILLFFGSDIKRLFKKKDKEEI
ncbi:MAG: signal peptidase I [Flavobacteriaceae bacterium]|nr:signal peptidase I [Flavobacteriaceae bacterium]